VMGGVGSTVFPEQQIPEPAAPASNPLLSDKLLDAKVRLHRRLIEEINLSALEKLPEDEMRGHVKQLVDEMTGLGPLEPLLKDQTISDILINGHECVYVERGGLLEPCGVRFKDESHLLRIINKIVSAVGRRVDESHPLCDARLLDGSRVNVAVRPVGVDGPLVSIRKFSKKPFNLNSWSSTTRSVRRWPKSWPRRCVRASRPSSPAAPAPARPPCSMRSPPSSRRRSA
jgi:pilus assembly protein CpaF